MDIKYQNLIKLFFLLILITIFGSKIYDFIIGNKLFYHDSLLSMSMHHVCYERLFHGEFPMLWTHLQNNGTPFWNDAESLPTFDPVTLLSWLTIHLFNKSSIVAYQTICFIKILIFAVGALLCSRKISKNWWINLTVFSIILFGSLQQTIVAQVDAFLHPFVYLPYVILSVLYFWEKPNYLRAIVLGGMGAISSASYQTIYSFVFLLIFFITYITIQHVKNEKRFVISNLKYVLLAFFVASLGILPTIISNLEALNLYLVVRKVAYWGYFFDPYQFFLENINLRLFSNWHGSTYIGILPYFFLIFIFSLFPLSLFSKGIRERVSKLSSLELTWILVLIPTTILCLGSLGLKEYISEHGTFLGVRNWGSLLTPVILIFSQLVAIGIREFLMLNRKLIILTVPFLTILLSAIIAILFNLPIFESTIPFIFLIITLFAIFVIYITYSIANYISKKTSKFSKASAFSFLLFIFTALNLYYLPSQNLHSQLNSTYLSIFNESLDIKPYKDNFVNYKEFVFDIPSHFFYAQGPLIHHKNYAILPGKSVNHGIYNFSSSTHAFRFPRFQDFITSDLSEDKKKLILGVTCPIINIVPYGISSDSFNSSINLLQDLSNDDLANKVVVIEGNIPEEIKVSKKDVLNKANDKIGNYKVISFKPHNIKLQVHMEKDGILTYADNYANHWKVYVNGKPRELLIANSLNKAVFLAKGDNIVNFVYKPTFYIIAFWFRIVFDILFITLLILIKTKKIDMFYKEPE